MFAFRILALAAAGALAPAVLAAPVSDPDVITRQVSVKTGDLNLANTAGQRTLRNRIQTAVTSVCGFSDRDHPEIARCRAVAYSGAKAQAASAIANATARYAQTKIAPAPAPTNTASGS